MNPFNPIETLTQLVLPRWLAPLMIAVLLAFALYKIYAFGVDTERTRWQTLESKKMAAAHLEILNLRNQKYDLEQKRVNDMANLTAKYNQEIKQNDDKAKTNLAAVRSGAIKLRIATVRPASCESGASKSSPTASGVETEIASELTMAASAALIGFAAQKDEVTILFNGCIDQLAADRGEKALEPQSTQEN